MSAPLRIGFVGGGFITRFHLQSLVAVRDCVVAGVSSRSRASAEETAALARSLEVGPQARAFASTEELAASPEVDALWICARNDTRLQVLDEILEGAARRSTPLRGVALEKPLARNLAEARAVLERVERLGCPHGYLEDMLFAPHLVRGKEVLWRRAVPLAGRPFLARAAEEHAGPHSAWFWQPGIAGGGVLLDMMCHSLEAARWLLTAPGAPRDSLTPVEVVAVCENLKWTLPKYRERLRRRFGPEVDWEHHPSEDFTRATIRWRTEEGQEVLTETTSSWCFTGAGLRHTFEVAGPEYSLEANLAETGLRVFLGREIQGEAGEDLVEKQNAEQGLMPVSPDEPSTYGYVGENRHFVRAFLGREPVGLDFRDGLEVVRLMMACYRSAEEKCAVDPGDPSLEGYRPPAARAAEGTGAAS